MCQLEKPEWLIAVAAQCRRVPRGGAPSQGPPCNRGSGVLWCKADKMGWWPGCFLKLTCQCAELLWQPGDLQFRGRVERDKTLSHGCHYSGMGATNTWQPLLLQLVSFHAWRSKMHKRLICIVNLLVKYVCVLHFRWVNTSSAPPLKYILVTFQVSLPSHSWCSVDYVWCRDKGQTAFSFSERQRQTGVPPGNAHLVPSLPLPPPLLAA